MPQSLSAVYLHFVFATKDRQPLLSDPSLRQELHSYMAGVSKRLCCSPILIGGIEGHVHALVRQGRTISQAIGSRKQSKFPAAGRKHGIRGYRTLRGRPGMASFRLIQPIYRESCATSRIKKSTTGTFPIKRSLSKCLRRQALNGTRLMFGTDYKTLSG